MAKLNIPKPGAAALVAAAFIGPGTITVCTKAGANFGMALLWALLFSAVATIILQNMSIRLTVATQKTLAENIREGFENKLIKISVSVLVLSAIFIGGIAYESGNIAGAALALKSYYGVNNLILGSLSLDIYGLLIGLIAALILYIGKYKFIERVLISLVLMMSLVFITTAIISFPSVESLFSGLIPSLPDSSTLTVIGLIGTTIVPYNLFLHSSAILKAKVSSYQVAKKDTVISISLGGLISMAIIITSSFVFFGKDNKFTNTYELANQLKPLLGSWSGVFMTIGFFAAGISSAITAPLAAAYTVAGIMNWEVDLRERKILTVWLSTILFGIVFYSLGIKPFQLISIAQTANGLLLPFVAIFLLVLVNNKTLLKDKTNTVSNNILGIVIIAIVLFLGMKSIYGVLT